MKMYRVKRRSTSFKMSKKLKKLKINKSECVIQMQQGAKDALTVLKSQTLEIIYIYIKLCLNKHQKHTHTEN